MAIAVTGGHVARAVDFYESAKESAYFVIGGTTPWTPNDSQPDDPVESIFKLNGIVGLKKVDNAYLVRPAKDGDTNTIDYSKSKWKAVQDPITTQTTTVINVGDTIIPVASLEGLSKGSKVRIGGTYEGYIVETSGASITLDTAAPTQVPAGSTVQAGAYVEGAKYVYVECHLSYDEFPVAEYRQIGLCTSVVPKAGYENQEILVPGQYDSLGLLEILDNRARASRDKNQRELLSLIIEF